MRTGSWKAVVGVVALGVGLASGAAALDAQVPREPTWTLNAANAEEMPRYAEYASQEVEGADIYRLARRALNGGDFEEAARLFGDVRRQFPRSALAGDTYYYEAFALYRLGQDSGAPGAQGHYQQAVELLVAQEERFPDAPTRSDANELMIRTESALARGGNAQAQEVVRARAQEPCDEERQELRAMALSALMNMDPDNAQPLLREVIADRDECNAEMRAQAVFILAQHDDEATVDLLLDIAHRNPDPDPEVRGAAVFWLSQVDRPEAVDALVSLVQAGGDSELMEGALFALSQHNDPRAFDALVEVLRTSSDAEVRGQAIFGLSQHGNERSVSILRELALDQSEDPEVRGQAVFWLGQNNGSLDDLRAIYEAASDEEVKNSALFAASQLDNSASVDFLMEVARSAEDSEVRSQAVFWLGQSDDPRVPQFLLELIRR